jgi:cardiolipin synthase (CMP-forming)
MEINPSRLSKANTAAQIALAALFLGLRSLSIDIGMAMDGLMLAVAALTATSAAAYLGRWLRHMTS